MTRAARTSRPDSSRPTALRSSRDFQRVLAHGTRRRVGGLTVVTLDGQRGAARVGLIVGKGVGKAVTRNRVKRRLRHALCEVKVPIDRDHVIIASKAAVDVAFERLVAWLDMGLKDER